MNPKTLNQFLALADALHFGRAALNSDTSVSSLSRNIQQLESDLGVVLFQRDNRSVALTNQGQVFEFYARDALMRLNNLRRELGDTNSPLKGELSIYCSVTASHSILFKLLDRFRPAYPQVDIKLITGDPEDAIDRIVAGKEDVAIAAHPNSLPRGIAFRPLVVSPLVFIAPLKRDERKIPSLDADGSIEWESVPMILSARGLARSRIDAWFRLQKIIPKVYAQVAGNEAIVSMVSLGLGMGVVPQIVLENSSLSANVVVINVQPHLKSYEVGLFTRNRNLENPIVKAFWSTE